MELTLPFENISYELIGLYSSTSMQSNETKPKTNLDCGLHHIN
jgi:hypothetical protein